MPFDVEQLAAFCRSAIDRFAAQHAAESFYAFAIDASLLCLNSEEQAAKTLKAYQEWWDRQTRPIHALSEMTDEDRKEEDGFLPLHARRCGLDRSNEHACLAVINERRDRSRKDGCPHRTTEGIRELRMNTGDWAYQGFADMGGVDGFDAGAYADHYDRGERRLIRSAYARTMDKLLKRLKRVGAFDRLRLTPDFVAIRVEHNY